MTRELILYCDESDVSGKHFSTFYGGALVESQHLADVIARLQGCKDRENLGAEVKWQKITEQYQSKYLSFVDETFDLMAEGKLKVRVMFTQNYFSISRPSTEQREQGFFRLYYQFVKHAFGLPHAGRPPERTGIRVYFDKLPDTHEKCAAFKGFVLGLNKNPQFVKSNIQVLPDQIAEIDSKEHVILQALDVLLGAVQFRLNDKHKEKPDGASRRGKRTVAKEKVYKHILGRVKQLYGGKAFNIGISTGTPLGVEQRWMDPYRHWLFRPTDGVVKPEFAKKR